MYDISVTEFVFEACDREKEEVNVVIPYAVIHFVLSGEGFINGRKIGKNTAFVAFEDTKMQYCPSRENPWSYIYVQLKGAELKRAFQEHGFSMGLTVCAFENESALHQLLLLYGQFSAMENPDAGKLIANGVFLLFEKRESLNRNTSKPLQHMEQIKRYIDENYYKKITAEEIAAGFYLNKNYVRTVFVRYLGLSPKQYLQKIRMERARYLLSSTGESVRLIANSVGYDDALLFSKMFRRYYGCSPSAYREKTDR